jgi:hypothetical protein
LPYQSPTTMAFTRDATVADGVFTLGHLGELTQYLSFELINDVLEQPRTVQGLRVLRGWSGAHSELQVSKTTVRQRQ